MEIGEVFDGLHELDCPRCHCQIGVVRYPTIKESRANWEDLPFEEQEVTENLERRQIEFDGLCLKRSDQLPEIKAEDFALTWDVSGGNSIIRHNDRIVFVEPSVFEGYERFKEVITILKDRYGPALKGVHLTRSAYHELCGDKLWAGNLMESFHADSFGDDHGLMLGSSEFGSPADLQNLPEDPAIRPLLLSNGIPRHLWPEGFISEQQAIDLIKKFHEQPPPGHIEMAR